MPPRARCALATCPIDDDLDDRGEPSGGMLRRWAYRAKAWAHGTVLTAHTGPGAHPTTVHKRRYAWHASAHAVCPGNMIH